MPTIFNINGYQFFFYSGDCQEPIHIHVFKNQKSCKIWVSQLKLAKNNKFSQKEIKFIIETISKNKDLIIRKWYEHCNKK